MTCWNPRCGHADELVQFGENQVCKPCLETVYQPESYCPGCGLGYGPTEEPEDADNYYIGCDFCDKWTHRFCDPELNLGFYDRHLLIKYACPSCRNRGEAPTWSCVSDLCKSSRTNDDQKIVLMPDDSLILVSVQETIKSSSPTHPCALVGFDFGQEKNPMLLLCLNGAAWQQWNQKPENINLWSSRDSLREVKHRSEWLSFETEITNKTFAEWPKAAKKRVNAIRARLTAEHSAPVEKVELASGLVDPGEDHNPEDQADTHQLQVLEFKPLQVVWAKVAGMLWAPAVVSFGYAQNAESPYVVFFLENSKTENSENKDIPTTNLPRWLLEEQEAILTPDEVVSGLKYAFLPASAIKQWDCIQAEGFIKQIHSNKRRELVAGVELARSIQKGTSQIPLQIKKDSLARQRAQSHTDESFQLANIVRPAIKLQHLKLFLEANLVEMHWRVIARSRQYVKVVHDEYYGGWHLIAAQDWPTDREIADGSETDVILVYPGEVLTAQEALAMESASNQGIHVDANRYVAEIPNTSVIMDKTGSTNINLTGTNLFVNGIKYCDPKSHLWAPGPTVNHERAEFCKLEPHHSTTDNMRGFWLQRKRGEVIYRGEPLFWSYDCGAGKFDEDFGLVGKPPPAGWRSSRKRAKIESN